MPGVVELVRQAVEKHHRALVLCRSGFVRRAVLERLHAEACGWYGVEVVTIEGAARQHAPSLVAPERVEGAAAPAAEPVDSALPEGHPWKELLSKRPKLRGTLRRHVQRARVLEDLSAGPLPPALADSPIGALVGTEWAKDDSRMGWVRLRDRLRRMCEKAPGSVIACGFDPDEAFTHCGRVDRVVREVLSVVPEGHWCSLADDGGFAEPNAGVPALRNTIHVSDVAAEARIAVRQIRHAIDDGSVKPGQVLVLCAHEDTARRFVAACVRNGVDVAEQHAERLSRHGLASLCNDLLDLWLLGVDGAVPRHAVRKVLSSPLLSRSAPPADGEARQRWLEAVLPPIALGEVAEGDPLRMSMRDLAAMLNSARRTSASFDHWIAAFGAWTDARRAEIAALGDADQQRLPALTRRVLSGAIAKRRLECVRAGVHRGTFAAMAELLTQLEVFDGADPSVQAIRAGLRDLGERLVNHEDMRELLASGVDSGQLGGGVSVLPYHEYDGRASEHLVLLDLHTKGVVKPPLSDAFGGIGSALEELGLPWPRREVEERVWLLGWAARSTKRCSAIVSHRDAGGRAVVPPIELNLTGAPVVQNHGLELTGLPEATARNECIARHDGQQRGWIDVQIDSEWIRAGARAEGFPALPILNPKVTALSAYDEFENRPEDCQPYLGFVGDKGVLTGLRWSPSGVEQFTGCRYRGYCARVLRLREERDRTEDAGVDELGTAMHASFEAAVSPNGAEPFRFVVPDPNVDQSRRTFVERSTAEFRRALLEAMGLNANDPAVLEEGGAIHHACARWEKHLELYAEKRILSVSDAEEQRRAALLKRIGLGTQAAHAELFRTFDENAPAAACRRLGKAMAWALCSDRYTTANFAERVGEFQECARDCLRKIGPVRGDEARMEAALATLSAMDVDGVGMFPSALRLLESSWIPMINPRGDGVVIGVEVEFGGNGIPLWLSENFELAIAGKIDALVEYDSGNVIEVRDFKSKKDKLPDEDLFDSLIKPQIPMYALAVRDGLVQPPIGDAEDKVLSMVQDPWRAPGVGPHRLPENPGDRPELLDGFRVRLAAILRPVTERQDFSLRPHPRACPILTEHGGYCDFKDACRMRKVSQATPDLAVDGADE